MVQFTTASSIAVLNLALMAATASAIPSRQSDEQVERRMFFTFGKVFKDGDSTSTVTEPAKDKFENQIRHPSGKQGRCQKPYRGSSARVQYEEGLKSGKDKKRLVSNELHPRLFRAAISLAKNGASRNVLIKPLKITIKNEIEHSTKPYRASTFGAWNFHNKLNEVQKIKTSEEEAKKYRIHEAMFRKTRRGLEFGDFEERDTGDFGLEEREFPDDTDLETQE
ncbi:hypothetical protein AX17_007143 [Amanita inopinata Kibby_2008]|nr:hypothetical protein AX17_007143 [Amanita inopinata Kibby_2008]